MPKNKKPRLHGPARPGAAAGAAAQQKKPRKMHTFSKLSTNADPTAHKNQSQGKKNAPQQRRPIVPFRRHDRILLVGEGDFSFARSLVEHHRCRSLLATSYDSQDTLYAKYPQAEPNVTAIRDAAAAAAAKQQTKSQSQSQSQSPSPSSTGPHVLFGVDARKLAGKDIRTGFPRRAERRRRPAWLEAKRARERGKDGATEGTAPRGGPWDLICFNFPHVGGLSTDVNRQVRANQELLVGFFKACVPLLAARMEGDDDGDDVEEDEWEWEENGSGGSGSESESPQEEEKNEGTRRRTDPGQILVSMFEGEPYTLWNIKDLARHAGLRVVTSFRFPWSSYKGYAHARTIGEIEGKHGGRGGWRGEDREARMYVFEVKGNEQGPRSSNGAKGKSKRARQASDSDESD